jgi:hypothetical protein
MKISSNRIRWNYVPGLNNLSQLKEVLYINVMANFNENMNISG